MTEQAPLKNLASKMIKIMHEVGYIQKTGYNAFHKYSYATEADVSSAISKAMEKHNVFMFSSIVERECQVYKTRAGKDAFLVTVKLQITFVDSESGESFVSTFFGDGTDSDDKAVYKAITGAQKYALMKTFMVATGDDPERDEKHEEEHKIIPIDINNINLTFEQIKNLSKEPIKIADAQGPGTKLVVTQDDRPASSNQVEEIRKLAAELEISDEEKQGVLNHFKVTSIDQLSYKAASKFIERLKYRKELKNEKR